MKIIGHPWIASEKFIEVTSIEDIKKTDTGSVILINSIEKSIELLQYCQREVIPSAARVDSIEMSIFANLLDVRYIISTEKAVDDIQALAQHYLYDTQIIVEIKDESEITRYAKRGIDGVIFPAAISQMESK